MVNGTTLSFQNMHHIVHVNFLQPLSDGCKIRKELYLNPRANISLHDSIITKFRDSGIEIKEEPIELERNYR